MNTVKNNIDLSIVLGGRDDNYGKDFIPRLSQALKANLKTLDASGIAYELIIVDYNPINNAYLHINPELSSVLNHSNVKNVIVDQSVIVKEQLGHSRYYEYFAKNAGIRRSSGELILVTNSDIIFSENLIEQIKKELTDPRKNKVFYRTRYRRSVNLNDDISKWYIAPGGIEDLNSPNLGDSCIAGYFSGDATMFSRYVMFEIATGYNEGNKGHRGNLRQSAMDGEILWNLYHKGIKLQFIDGPYYHIEHERPTDRDGVYQQDTYMNNHDWGYSEYKERRINDNTIEIYFKE